MRRTSKLLVIVCMLFISIAIVVSEEQKEEIMLVHLKTSLKRDDAQICVAYNIIWAALEEDMKVEVLIDADAVYTYKVGWRGKDSLEGYKLPENLKNGLSEQFNVPIESVPKTYGEYLMMLKDRGVGFFINKEMLVVSGIGTPDEPLNKISAKFFKPVSLKEMVRLRKEAQYYLVY